MFRKCVDVVVGFQAGSEAKGKMVSFLPHEVDYGCLVRTGGCNAAHTIYLGEEKILFHQLPCGSLHFPHAAIILGANAQIDHEYLLREIQILKDHGCWLGVNGKPRLIIDKNATIIDPIDKIAESGGRMPACGEMYFRPMSCVRHNQLGGTCVGCDQIAPDSAWLKLGSTTHGAGANAIRKILRGTKMAVLAGQKMDVAAFTQYEQQNPGDPTNWVKSFQVQPVRYASEDEITKPFIGDTVAWLNDFIDAGINVLLEGTQGSVLSLHHGYPGKTTSRDTNAATWCAEAGVSPLTVRDVYGVARTFPIRVAGDSGPMSGEEITWEHVTAHAQSPNPIEEITSATRRRRRVFTFGIQDFQKSLAINRPTKLMLTFVDYLHYSDYGKNAWDMLSSQTQAWVENLEESLKVRFHYLSTGPLARHTIVRF